MDSSDRAWRRELLLAIRRHRPSRPPKLPDVNACYWCDQTKQDHYNRWATGPGWHKWTAPTDGLRKMRLIAIRADRRRAAA